jgi:hypothetical protein
MTGHYWQQTDTIVRRLRSLVPDRPLHPWFLQIVRQGTGKEFTTADNNRWSRVTRPIVEAFFHARFFLELNRRVVERLQFIRSAKSLTQLARFSVGMAVEFDTDDGRTISGTVARLNQKTATVLSTAGRWRVSPSQLRPVSVAQGSEAASRIVAMPRRRHS